MPPITPEQIEELRAAQGQLAALLSEYRDDLVTSGFTRQEALALCTAFQQTVMQGAIEAGEQ